MTSVSVTQAAGVVLLLLTISQLSNQQPPPSRKPAEIQVRKNAIKTTHSLLEKTTQSALAKATRSTTLTPTQRPLTKATGSQRAKTQISLENDTLSPPISIPSAKADKTRRPHTKSAQSAPMITDTTPLAKRTQRPETSAALNTQGTTNPRAKTAAGRLTKATHSPMTKAQTALSVKPQITLGPDTYSPMTKVQAALSVKPQITLGPDTYRSVASTQQSPQEKTTQIPLATRSKMGTTQAVKVRRIEKTQNVYTVYIGNTLSRVKPSLNMQLMNKTHLAVVKPARLQSRNRTQYPTVTKTTHQRPASIQLGTERIQNMRVNATKNRKIKLKVQTDKWRPFFRESALKSKIGIRHENSAALNTAAEMELSLSAILIEHHLIVVWTVTAADTTEFMGFRVLCMHKGDEAESAKDRAEHISPILGPTLRSYTPFNLIVDGHYTVCMEILFNATTIIKQQCRSVEPLKPSVLVGILAGCVFLVPCIIFVIYIFIKDHSLRQKCMPASVPTVQRPLTAETTVPLKGRDSSCISISTESYQLCLFEQDKTTLALQPKTSASHQESGVAWCAQNGASPQSATDTVIAEYRIQQYEGEEAEEEEEEKEETQLLQSPATKHYLTTLPTEVQKSAVTESSGLLAQASKHHDVEESLLDLDTLLKQLQQDSKSDNGLRESKL